LETLEADGAPVGYDTINALGTIADRYGPAYRACFGRALSTSQLQAMQAIEACRTEALGGRVYSCPSCQLTRYSYHSCRNRHCPTCQQEATQAWLVEQQALLLPVPYFLVTFTLPSELRAIARAHPEELYPLLFRTSAAALQQLAYDPRFLGGQIGMLGVLQTWTRDLRYHPHVHYLVPALALTPDAKRWLVGKHDFLMQVKPLGERVQGQVPHRVAADTRGRQGGRPRLGQIVGGGLSAGRERGERPEVSRSIHLPHCPKQQPHRAGGKRGGHVSLHRR
jgi:hypothetical protein